MIDCSFSLPKTLVCVFPQNRIVNVVPIEEKAGCNIPFLVCFTECVVKAQLALFL